MKALQTGLAAVNMQFKSREMYSLIVSYKILYLKMFSFCNYNFKFKKIILFLNMSLLKFILFWFIMILMALKTFKVVSQAYSFFNFIHGSV